MSRRREANRAEASIKGVGALVLAAVFVGVLYTLPYRIKGKDTDQILQTLLHQVHTLTLLGLGVGVIGLIVWLKVMKGKGKGKR